MAKTCMKGLQMKKIRIDREVNPYFWSLYLITQQRFRT